MVSRQLRSRSKKRRSVRIPSGTVVIHYGKKKPEKHHCGRCGNELHGTPNAIPSKIRKMRKTERIPERPYAGILCNECMESLMRYKTKYEIKFNYPGFHDMDFQRDLTIEKFLPRGWWQDISSGKKKEAEGKKAEDKKVEKEKVKPKKRKVKEKEEKAGKKEKKVKWKEKKAKEKKSPAKEKEIKEENAEVSEETSE